MKQKKSVEDYLKVIYILSQKKEVHGADIAGELKVSRPTVSVALKALAEEGYIFVDGAYEIHLTVKGRRVAEDTYETIDWYDALVLDCIWFCHSKKVRIPGTEDMAEYRDYLFHIRQSQPRWSHWLRMERKPLQSHLASLTNVLLAHNAVAVAL